MKSVWDIGDFIAELWQENEAVMWTFWTYSRGGRRVCNLKISPKVFVNFSIESVIPVGVKNRYCEIN